MTKTFTEHYLNRRKDNPNEPKYISLCYVIEYSGDTKKEVEEKFDLVMDSTDYDPEERETMITYLSEIAQDKNYE